MNHAISKSRKIIVPLNFVKEDLVKTLNVSENKIVVTTEGFDSNIKKGKVPQKIFEVSKDPYFLYVGNAYPHKNLESLLKAFSTFCHPELVSGSQDSDFRQNDTMLVLVGKEDYFYKRLRRKVDEMNLSKNVIFMQDVTDEELSSLYQNALALVLPSLMEGFGLTALEAMVNKCLVLASDIPSLREVCADAVIYFDPLNVDDLSKKLTMIKFHTTEYGGLREKGLERAKLFSWEKMAKQTLAIYEQSVSSP